VVLEDDAARDGELSLAALEARSPATFDARAAAAEVTRDDLSTLVYTSGTTGPPKGVQFRHGALLACLDSIRQRFATTEQDRARSWRAFSTMDASTIRTRGWALARISSSWPTAEVAYSETGTAPSSSAPMSTMWNSMRVPISRATLSPRCTPSPASPPATDPARAAQAANVRDSFVSNARSATWSGWSSARRRNAADRLCCARACSVGDWRVETFMLGGASFMGARAGSTSLLIRSDTLCISGDGPIVTSTLSVADTPNGAGGEWDS
jgi:hypothetical protein